jgi:hypothetical protein
METDTTQWYNSTVLKVMNESVTHLRQKENAAVYQLMNI